MDMMADKDKMDQARQTLAKAVKEGKLKHDSKTETVVEAQGGISGVPKVWTRLFEGANTGKLVTALSSST